MGEIVKQAVSNEQNEEKVKKYPDLKYCRYNSGSAKRHRHWLCLCLSFSPLFSETFYFFLTCSTTPLLIRPFFGPFHPMNDNKNVHIQAMHLFSTHHTELPPPFKMPSVGRVSLVWISLSRSSSIDEAIHPYCHDSCASFVFIFWYFFFLYDRCQKIQFVAV